MAHATDESPTARIQEDVEPNLSCVFLVMHSFNAAPLPEQFVTLREGTLALKLGEGPADDIPEDWVRVKRLGDLCNLGDGKVGLVPPCVLWPVPVEQHALARSVLQKVHNQRITTATVVEERQKSEPEQDEEVEEVQQPSIGPTSSDCSRLSSSHTLVARPREDPTTDANPASGQATTGRTIHEF